MATVREPTETLLERERELAALEEASAAADAEGTTQLVVVSGEAGAGKTALVRRFCAGRRVLWGSCEPLLTPSPLAPLAQIAAEVGGPLERLLAEQAKPHMLALALSEELRGRRPAILVLEDVHWADAATLDVLRLLGSRRTVASTVVVTYREEDVGRWHPLRLVLAHLETGFVRRLRVAPLSPDAVSALAAADGADGNELFRLTSGNPYLVVEALAAGEEIPPTVRDVVLARAAAVGPAALLLLEVVSVSPSPLELSLLEEVAPAEVAALDECLACGLLLVDGSRFRFRHELTRLAFCDSLPPYRARSLHRSLLRALEHRPYGQEDSARLAHHAEAGGDDAAAVRHATAAAERAERAGAHRESAAQYARALRCGADLPAAEYAALSLRRSLECFLTTEDAEALAAAEDAAARFRALGSRHREANALRWQALVLFNMGRSREAASIADRAVELLAAGGPGHDLAMAHCAQAAVSLLFEDASRTTAQAEQALAIIRPLEDRHAYVTAIGSLGAAEALAGLAAGRRTLQDALALATELGHDAEIGRCHVLLAMAGCRRRSLADMTDAVEAGLAFCEEHDLAVWGRILLATRAWVELERGDWDRAAETAALVLATRCTLSSMQALIVLGLLRARRGDPDPWTPLTDAAHVASRTGALWWTSQIAAAQAEAAWLEGRADRIPALTDAAYRAARDVGSPWPTSELAFWRSRAGIVDDCGLVEPFASHLRGDVETAAAGWRRAGCPYEAALALADAHEEEPLLRALEELQRLGARPAAARTSSRLRERGVRRLPRGPRPSTRANAANLTRRESEVLALLAEGLPNREIAARLFLSPRTIENHVAAVLRKLDVRTRVQAVQQGMRLGLLG